MREDECLYVGKSVNLRNRWNAHEKLAEVGGGEGLRLVWKPTPEGRLDAAEREMIALLKPHFNYNLVPRPLRMPEENKPAMNGADISTTDAAERLGITRQRVLQLIEAGRLPAKLFANVYMIREADLKLVEDRKPGRPPTKKAGKR